MRTVAYCGDYTALTTTRWGDKIYVDTRDTSLAPHIMLEGDWETWVSNAFAAEMQSTKGAVVVDVGANVGWYTLLACKLGAKKVFAFEPNPRMVELLKMSVAVNGYKDRVSITQAACLAYAGAAVFTVDPREVGGGHIGGAGAATSTVDTVRLDEVIPDRVDIIKIDVEGYEPEVIAGAAKLLESRPRIFLEHHQKNRNLLVTLTAALSYDLRHVRYTGHYSPVLSVDEAAALGDAETIFCRWRQP
jgi:FkbM family methyltransferase